MRNVSSVKLKIPVVWKIINFRKTYQERLIELSFRDACINQSHTWDNISSFKTNTYKFALILIIKFILIYLVI
jgi:hypothetical protein